GIIMYNTLNFHTVNEVSKKLGLPEKIIMDLIKRNILEAVSVADTGIWIVEEKAVLKFLAKGNNFKNNYGTESMDIKAVDTVATTSNNENHNSIDREVYIKEKEVMSNNSSNASTAINIHHNNKLNTVKTMMINKVITSNKNANDVSVNSHNFNNSNNLNIEIDASNLSGEELIGKVKETLSSVTTTPIEESNMNKEYTMESSMANTLTKEKEEIEVTLENTFNKTEHTSKISNKNKKISKDIVLSKSDVVKHKDGNYVANNKFFNEENVIAEFIFDAEQAKKPVTDEIVLSKLDFNDNVHICDDQEANAELLRKYDKGHSV
ncbi:MAG: helix-turn-helix domain-containing protein, partial [Sarcina sp.]